MKTRKGKELGQYIVMDPDICHGQPTFKGTRIMVKSVLEMLVKGGTGSGSRRRMMAGSIALQSLRFSHLQARLS